MAWDVELSEECEQWFKDLDDAEKRSIAKVVVLLKQHGPTLARPYADKIQGSKHQNMKELRVQHQGRPYRVLFCFDPTRTGILLIGGDKTGDNRWYETNVPNADKIYDEHLETLRKAGKA